MCFVRNGPCWVKCRHVPGPACLQQTVSLWLKRRVGGWTKEKILKSPALIHSRKNTQWPHKLSNSALFLLDIGTMKVWMMLGWRCSWCKLADPQWLQRGCINFCQLWIWPIKPVYSFLETISTDTELIAWMLTFLAWLSTALWNTLDWLCRASTDSLFLQFCLSCVWQILKPVMRSSLKQMQTLTQLPLYQLVL